MKKHNRRQEERVASREVEAGAAGNSTASSHTAPHEDAIRLLAYRKWEEAGHPPGNGVDFWLMAERELVGHRG